MFARIRAVGRVEYHSLLPNSQAHNVGKLSQFLVHWNLSRVVFENVLVDVDSAVVAHVHCSTATFDTGPRSNIACGEMASSIRHVAIEV